MDYMYMYTSTFSKIDNLAKLNCSLKWNIL